MQISGMNFGTRSSITLLYIRTQKSLKTMFSGFSNYVREKIRTPDTLVRSQVLYPAELHTHIIYIASFHLQLQVPAHNRINNTP